MTPRSRNCSVKLAAQCLVANLVTTDPHVVHEQADERVEISGIERDGVATCQLTDLLVCHEPGDGVAARAVQAARIVHGWSGSSGAQGAPLIWLPPSTNRVFPVR